MTETKLSEQVRTETDLLQQQVNDLLKTFEEKTGLRISEIVVCREMNPNRLLGAKIRIEL